MLEKRITTIIIRNIEYTALMRKIGLQLRFQDGYDMAVAQGVIDYGRTKENWRIMGQGPLFSETLSDCDGLIARIESEEEARHYASLGMPVVDIANSASHGLLDMVSNDDHQTGRLAGSYFKELGSGRVGWCGVRGVRWASQRLQGFSQGMQMPLERIATFTRSLGWWRQLYEPSEELDQWLDSLERPIALFCCNDLSAMKTELACQRLGIKIPEEVMVLGVDNETLLCELASPSISSIQPDCRAIGYGAAALLDELLTDRTRPVQSRRVPPLPIIERESSRYVFCDDEHVARALRMIRAEATDGLTAAEVAQVAHIGRRSLEMRFKRERGRTILEEIQEYRLREAERLLIHTTLAVKEIVQLCGFASEHRFFSLFRSAHGMTPLSFRAARNQLL